MRDFHHIVLTQSPFTTTDDNRYKSKDLYVFYGDLEKCFDRLWLKDSLVELLKTGIRANKIIICYEMNKCSITIETPFGKTKKIEVEEVVRQGTIQAV